MELIREKREYRRQPRTKTTLLRTEEDTWRVFGPAARCWQLPVGDRGEVEVESADPGYHGEDPTEYRYRIGALRVTVGYFGGGGALETLANHTNAVLLLKLYYN